MLIPPVRYLVFYSSPMLDKINDRVIIRHNVYQNKQIKEMKQASKNTRKAVSKTRKTSHKSKAVSRATSKTAPKGLTHHAKRVYHGTPKFVHGMVVGGVFGLLVVGFLGGSFAHPSLTNALTSPSGGSGTSSDSSCIVKTDANNTFTLNKDGTITALFNVVGTDCHQAVTLVSWQAPNGITGKPYSEQKFFASSTVTFRAGTHELSVKLPDCYFQVDLIKGSEPTDTNGGAAYVKEGRLRRSFHGGSHSCTPPTTTTTPETPAVEKDSATLPNTGPGAVILIFVMALAGGYLFHVTHHHRARRAAHAHAGRAHHKR